MEFFVADDQTGDCVIHRAASQLGYDNLAGGSFAVGDTVTDQTSGAQAVVISNNGSTLGLIQVTDTFGNNNQISNGGGVTANVNGTISNGAGGLVGCDAVSEKHMPEFVGD
jgi:hypothetical protein